jgi:hypothetical protein
MKKLFSAFTWQQYVMMVVVYLIVNQAVWEVMDYYYNYLI